MRIRFRIYHETEKTTLGISIQCNPRELSQISSDMHTITEDNLQEPTKDLLEAIEVMTGQRDFSYHEVKDQN